MGAPGQLQGMGWPSPHSGGEKGYSLPQEQNSPAERGGRGLPGGRAVSRWLQLGLPGSRCGFQEAAF